MLDKIKKFVQYYLGEHAESISDVVLTHLARRLDEAKIPYCCFWAFVINKFEKNKLVHRNFIESSKVWNMFLEDRLSKEEHIENKVGIEINRFHIECRLYAPDEVLMDTTIQLSPLFRYSMGKVLGISDSVCDQWKNMAVQQLREEPWYFSKLNGLSNGFPITYMEVMGND